MNPITATTSSISLDINSVIATIYSNFSKMSSIIVTSSSAALKITLFFPRSTVISQAGLVNEQAGPEDNQAGIDSIRVEIRNSRVYVDNNRADFCNDQVGLVIVESRIH